MKISVIGLGYVGLPLALAFGKKYETIGFDINSSRVKELLNGVDKNNEIKKKIILSKKLKLTNNKNNLTNTNIFIITVPTPIYKNKTPNLTLIKEATKLISKYINHKNIIIYESTVYPGVTEEICGQIISSVTGYELNTDFFLGYSPERINPGDKKHTLTKIVKLISASNKSTLTKIDKLYSSIINAGTYKVESIKIAEAAKVIENTQRDINIAYVNELKIIFDKLNLDTNKILKAASTKWNFLNFKPGLVGGHCIGIDPYYLHHAALKKGYKSKIILAGRKLNDSMVAHYFNDFNFKFKKHIKKNYIKNPKILFLGLSFKSNTNDLRNSKSIDLLLRLKKKFLIDVYDPLINVKEFENQYMIKVVKSKNINIKLYDGIIYSVNHDYFHKFNSNDDKIFKYYIN